MGEQSSRRRTVVLTDLPDSLLLEIFFLLTAEDLGTLAQTCSRFARVTRDELLWKKVFRKRYKIPASVSRRPGATSWRSEYRRLKDETPAVLCEELQKHRDQVLHVSFSHNGDMFATCSKDGKILVWNSESPSTLRFSANMTEEFNWRYSQFSQFNKTDTLLLVSGVFHGNMTMSGEIAVFDLTEFTVQCRVTNKPYDVFGCWYNNQHLFSGSLYWNGHLQSTSALWLNRASQEVESERESVMMNLYRFSNVSASSIRTVMVADVPVLSSNNSPSSEEDLSRREAVMETEEEEEEVFSTTDENGDAGDMVTDGEEENRNNSCAQAVHHHRGDGGLSQGGRTEAGAALHSDAAHVSGCDRVNGDLCQVMEGGVRSQVPTEGRKVAFSQRADVGRFVAVSGSADDKQPPIKNGWHSSSGGGDVQVCVRLKGTKTSDLPSSSSSSSSSSAKACYPFAYCCTENNDSQRSASEHELEAMESAGGEAGGGGFFCDSDSSFSCSPGGNVRSLTSSSLSVETPSTAGGRSPLPLPPQPQRHSSDIPRLCSSPHLTHHHHRHPHHRRGALKTEKLLIFTMGDETYTPHLVGFKRILLQDIVGKEEAERRRRRRRKGAEEGEGGCEEGVGVEEEEEDEDRVLLPNVEENLQGMNLPPTQVDHTVNLKGHIVGMALSPDHRYLYVNSRQWPPNYFIESVLEPPPIAQEIDIHVIDLVTFQEVGKVMSSHKAFTPNNECFFLFLDVSAQYVASGAEDRRGYMWDRHYGVHLHCFPHNDVVNSVAFNPRDQEMLVTVSDDNSIKVWRSQRQMRKRQKHVSTPKECQA
ncbi:F-box/WD repeat-containing protein 5-like [Babylonia areolata]|uniref:F-box/WD repeat-containing protein 5-like n=1 Tax=Babylonia areolata TaxID=304850 RepID=UPI003FD5B69E